MVTDIRKLEAAARMAMGHFETSDNRPVRRRSRFSGLGAIALAVLAVLAVLAMIIALRGTF